MIDYIIIAAYILGVLGLGVWCSKSNKTLKEFAVSNSDFGTFFIFTTLSASFIGGGFSLGNAAKVYSEGIYYSVMLLGFSLQIILVSLLVVPHISKHVNAISVGDIIEPCYGKSGRITGGILSFCSCAGILGAQIGGMGAILESLLGIPYFAGALIGCAVILIYSTIGGIKAVVLTDAVQFCLLIVAVPLLLIIGIYRAGGVNAVIEQLPPERLQLQPDGVPPSAILSLFLVFFIGETLVPPYVQRLLISRDRRKLMFGTFWSGVLSVPFFLVSGAIGLVALILLPEIDANTTFPAMVKLLIPTGLKGIVIASIMAIVMSSADSFLHSASVAVVKDVYLPLAGSENMPDRHKLLAAQFVNVVTGAAALLFVLFIPNILDVLVFAYNFWSPLILVQLVSALIGLKVRKSSFFVGFFAGLAGSLAWNLTLGRKIPFDGLLVGVACNLICFTLYNLVRRPPTVAQKDEKDSLILS